MKKKTCHSKEIKNSESKTKTTWNIIRWETGREIIIRNINSILVKSKTITDNVTIAEYFNRSFKQINFSTNLLKFPNKLKLAVIKPLHKKGNRLLIDNYRPVALVPTISKVYEKVFLTRLSSHLSKHAVISEKSTWLPKEK